MIQLYWKWFLYYGALISTWNIILKDDYSSYGTCVIFWFLSSRGAELKWAKRDTGQNQTRRERCLFNLTTFYHTHFGFPLFYGCFIWSNLRPLASQHFFTVPIMSISGIFLMPSSAAEASVSEAIVALSESLSKKSCLLPSK